MLKKVLTKFLTLSLLLILVTPGYAQQLGHVQGEILVKLWPDADLHVRHWVQSKRTLNGLATGVEYKKRVSAPMDIHAITFDHSTVDEWQLLHEITRDPLVQAAQFDHFVTLRSTIPDDPQFDDQWQYINTGQGGGTVGADIDMDLAWDVTTGGITADGDTIVSCIIDDGINLNHPDMMANLWVNHAEIPGNGIDDDNNGFVDDYRGWDTGSNSDGVGDGGGHGTPVAGIVGAVGNNGVGVAGVNWNVKLMIVQGGTGVESEVLEAYSYPLVARQKYNETNGDEGAFVVSTNASWGIDQGQPSNAPLWCAFYDTLGVHGILNCGATANANFNIDVVGDLPTGCPSDYMIAVTNMNRNDVKVNSAGYGIETIDLGAFGAQTWTTSFNSYGSFGGTSGATPHVTGSIALLYSAPCPALISLAKSDPEAAASQVRDYIFEGTDPNASLDGITVTGGRLNVANAMSLLMANCGPCPPPTSFAVSETIDASTMLDWNINDSIQTTNLLWRVVGAIDWNTEENVSSPYSLSGLTACTEYEVQVVGICSGESASTPVVTFQTDGCCENPAEFAIGDITQTSATANWSSVFAALSYNVRISEAGLGAWNELNSTDLSVTFSGLSPCTDYEVQIQVLCDGNQVDYSESQFFTTFGCGACTDLTYCTPEQADISEEWIANVTVGDLSNSTGEDGSYGDFTAGGPTAELATNLSYDLSLSPGFAGQTFNEGFRVWIDFNQNGSFTDAGEQVFDSGSFSNQTVTGSISIPSTALLGLTRLRVGMAFNASPNACDINSDFGEMEDYCVTIIEGMFICAVPLGLDTSNVTTSSADLSWDDVNGATSYIVRHKKTSETTWTETNSNNSNLNLSGLDSGTEYEAQVKTVCDGNGESDFSDSKTFTTIIISSVRTLDDLQSWNIFPNPFNGSLAVDFAFANPQAIVRIELLDQLGRTVQQQVLENIPAGQQQVRLVANDFTDGIYFLRLSDADGRSLSKKVLRAGY